MEPRSPGSQPQLSTDESLPSPPSNSLDPILLPELERDPKSPVLPDRAARLSHFQHQYGSLSSTPCPFQVLPYITTIFGGLTHGKMVLVQGVVLAEAERFQVDFQCGCSLMPRPDIAVHFNPRFRSRPHVICNTLQNGRWLEETKFPHLPLKRGEAFQSCPFRELNSSSLQVSVNGQHFLQYRSRLPLARVDTVGVFGDITVKSLHPQIASPSGNSWS
uniref:Galectin n=1 Tax=Chelonoidis abingdonii TaxID=106734 RepID=A0A8C0FYC2_CHEAB